LKADSKKKEEIKDSDLLYRRLHRFALSPDGSVNSAAFKENGVYPWALSADLARLLAGPEQSLARANRPELGVGGLLARVPRGFDFLVEHDPLPTNDAHTAITGENSRIKAREMAVHTVVLIRPR
jgi:hypothetical protein